MKKGEAIIMICINGTASDTVFVRCTAGLFHINHAQHSAEPVGEARSDFGPGSLYCFSENENKDEGISGQGYWGPVENARS
jgi:hypothetical protein